MCVHAINAPSTLGWWKCICRVFTAGYQVPSRPAMMSHMHSGVVCATPERVGESVRGFTRSGRLQERLWGQWLPWTQRQGEEHLRAESLLCRGKSPFGWPAGESLIVSSNTPTPRRKERKKFCSSVPGIAPQASPPVRGSRCAGQKHTSFN